MVIRNISITPKRIVKNLALTGTFLVGALSMISCKNKPFKELDTNLIPPIVIETVDSFSHESLPITENSNYLKFGEDTLEFKKSYLTDKKTFFEDFNNSSKRNVPRTKTGQYTTMLPLHTGKSTIFIPQTHFIYTDNFIKTKTVIMSKKMFTKNKEDLYIPVQYYGIQNPKLK